MAAANVAANLDEAMERSFRRPHKTQSRIIIVSSIPLE
jgi:hypothetical protein